MWNNPAGGDWDTASNWRGGVLPGANDDAVINVAASVTITHSQSVTDTIKSLTISNAGDSFVLSGGTLSIATTLSSVAPFTLAGTSAGQATLAGATIQAGTTISGQNQNSAVLDGVTLGGTLNLYQGFFDLAIANNLTLSNGTINLGFGASVHFDSTQTLGGTGNVTFTDSDQNSLGVRGTANTLTIGSGVTISGPGGTVYSGNSTLDNHGTIIGNSCCVNMTITGTNWTNEGTIEALGGLVSLEGSWTNSGMLKADQGGTLGLNGTTWHNSGTTTSTNNSTVNLGGTFAIADIGTFNRTGGTVNLTGTLNNTGTTLALNNTTGTWTLAGGTINGGTVSTAGTAVLQGADQSQGFLNGVTLAGTLDIDRGGYNLAVTNGLTMSSGTVDMGFGSYLHFDGTQTVAGTGSLFFTGNGFFTTMGLTGAGSVLTIATGITIHGVNGTFSTGTDTFDNRGVINGDTAGLNPLHVTGTNWTNEGTIESVGGNLSLEGTWTSSGTLIADQGGALGLNGTTWHNTGTLTSTNNSSVYLGGTFTLADLGMFNRTGGVVYLTGVLNNTGTTLALNDTNGSWVLLGGTIQGGTVSTAGSAQLQGSDNSTGALSGVTLAGTLEIARGNYNLAVTNGLTLANGMVDMAYGSYLHFDGTQTLGGTGNLLFNGNGFFTTLGVTGTGSVLTIAPGIIIHGTNGTISAGTDSLDNQGTINGDLSTTTIPLTVTGTNWTNEGTLEAAGGVLSLAGTYSSSGSIAVSNSGTVNLGGTWSSTGTISDASGAMNLGGTFSTSRLGTLVGQGGINLTGTLTNDATLSLNNATGSVNLRGGTINGGTIATTGNAELVALYEGGTLNGVTLAGTLDEDVAQVRGGPLNVTGGMTLSNGTIKIGAGNVIHFIGRETLGGTGTFLFADSNTSTQLSVDNNGALTIGASVMIHGNSGIVGTAGSSVTNNGTVASDGAGTISVLGVTNYATGTLTGGTWQVSNNSILEIMGANVTTNAASVVIDGAGSRIYSDTANTNAFAGLAANAASGQFTIQNGANLNLGPASLMNGGSLTVGAGSALTVASYTQTAGSTTLLGTLGAATPAAGTPGQSTVSLQGGTLSGAGTLNADVANAGQVMPGPSLGILTVNGNYAQSSTGTLDTEVGGTTPGTGYSQFAVSGTATLGGTLNVTLVNGFGPSSGQVFQIITFASASGSFATVNIPQVSGSPAFVTQSTPTSFNLVEATSAPDLTPTSVTFSPTTGVAGENITVNFTVANQGTVAATGSWEDSVYLSTTSTLSASALLLGRVTHTGNVAGLGSYTGSLTAPLPEGAIGNYQVLVLVDSRDQVPDGNRANNLGAAAIPLPITVPMLPLGTVVSGTIANGQDVYYHLVVPPTDDVNILASYSTATEAEFYLRYLSLPDRTNFDQSVTDLSNLAPQLTLSNAQGGDYYILLHGREGAGTGQPFALDATVVAFGITSVGPTTVSNAGQATITFTGRNFSPQTVVSLQTPAGVLISPTQTTWQSSTTIVATFNLSGQPAGVYNARVSDSGQTATLTSALTVQTGSTGTPGQFQARIVTAQYLRPFEPGLLDVEISNPGDTDVPAGIFRIRAENAIMGLGNAIGTSFVISLATPSGSSFILPPHFDQHIRIGFQPIQEYPHAQVHFYLTVSQSNSSTIDWSTFLASLRPSYMSIDAWPAIFANFTATVGSTAGQFESALAQDASYLSSLGVPDQSHLLGFELAKADDELPVPPLAPATDDAVPAPGLPLTFSRSFPQSISGRYQVGILGRGWMTPFDMQATTDSAGNVTIQTSTGWRSFTRQSGTLRGAPGDFATLTVDNNGYHLRETSGTRIDFRPDGRFASISDLNGNSITAAYTGTQLTSLTHSDGSSMMLSYNSQGRVSQVTDSASRVITYSYDASGEHLIGVTSPSGTVSYTYLTGQGAASEHALTSITLPDGTHRFFDYDAQGRLMDTHGDNNSLPVHFSYVSAGGVETTDATGASQTVFYNQFLRPARLQDALGRIQQITYDASQNIISEGVLNGPTTSFVYDTQGDPIETIDPLGQTAHLSYSFQPTRLAGYQDANGNATSYSYDSQGNLVRIVQPDGSSTQFVHDPTGNITQTTDARGQAIAYSYDARGLITREGFPDGSHNDYSYDAHGNLISATDATGTTTLQYDSADRLTQVTYPDGRSLQYTYDAAGRRTSMVDQSGFTARYAYDSLGRLTGMRDAQGNSIVTYSYDAAGRLTEEDAANGTYTTYRYDAAGELLHLVNFGPRPAAGQDGPVLSRFDYTYDALGNVASLTTLAGTTMYGYDADGRLTSISLPSGRSITYAYDAAGNRVAVTDNGNQTSYSTNSLNEYVNVGGATLTYDANGNLTRRTDNSGTTTYTYDIHNRLAGTTGPDGVWAYQYDSLGNLFATTHNGQRVEVLRDPIGGGVVGQYDGTGALIAHYTQGLGLTSRVDPTGASAFYGFDAQGNTAQLTGPNGAVANSYSYLPFGDPLSSNATISNPFTFSGQYGVMSGGAGLQLTPARAYDSQLGRFNQQDPIGLRGGTNLYRYAANNPNSFIDPSGNNLALVFVATFAVALGAIAAEVQILETYDPDPIGDGLGITNSYAPYAIEQDLSGAGEPTQFHFTFMNPNGTFYPANWSFPGISTYRYLNSAYQGVNDEFSTNSNWAPEWQQSLLDGAEANILNQQLATATAEILFPMDPNGIAGPSGFGTSNFVAPNQVFPYRIDFQNQPSASAPAQQVVITQHLDPNVDPSTLQLGEFGFGGQTFFIPAGLQFYHTRIDERATRGVFVDVTAALDTSADTVTWTFTSLDPQTLDLPANLTVGFLPPDTTAPEGEGFVSYSVQPKTGLSTGTAINAQASVVFDTNAPVTTNTFTNTIDAGPPTSSVASLPPRAASSSFTVNWSGQDDAGGSGIAAYDVFVSDNGGPFTPLLTATTQTSATFTGQFGHTYGFYSVATDNVGNRQPTPTASQATIQLIDPFQLYVTALYHAMLSRAPSPAEVAPWVQFLDSGGTELRVAQAFWESEEHRGIQIDGYYRTYLNRVESSAERAIWIAAMAGGLTEIQVIRGFLASSEYQATHSSNASFIDSLYANVLGRTEAIGERNEWLQFLQTGGTRDRVEQLFLTCGEKDTRVVDSYYANLLGRTPDQPGESAWSNLLLAGQGTWESIAEAFLASSEFYAKSLLSI
jgi:RHS repeat-associated protein